MLIIYTIIAAWVFIIGFIFGAQASKRAFEKKLLLKMMDDTLKTIKETTNYYRKD